jgi:hypothetical protein
MIAREDFAQILAAADASDDEDMLLRTAIVVALREDEADFDGAWCRSAAVRRSLSPRQAISRLRCRSNQHSSLGRSLNPEQARH